MAFCGSSVGAYRVQRVYRERERRRRRRTMTTTKERQRERETERKRDREKERERERKRERETSVGYHLFSVGATTLPRGGPNRRFYRWLPCARPLTYQPPLPGTRAPPLIATRQPPVNWAQITRKCKENRQNGRAPMQWKSTKWTPIVATTHCNAH